MDCQYATFRLKAGALQYTMLVAFVVMLITGFLILSYYLNGRMVDDQIILQRLHNRVESALNTYISDPESLYDPATIQVQVFEEVAEPIEIAISNWGAYKVLHAIGKQFRFTVDRTVLAGADILEAKLPAIYLTDNKRYLTVSGKNIIVGDCLLPKYGVDRGRFGGEGFSGKDAVVGSIKQSDERLPALSPSLLVGFQSLLAAEVATDTSLNQKDLSVYKNLTRSFAETPLLIESFGVVDLQNISLYGHIVVQSDTLVMVDASTHLDNVIIVAPYIEIKSGFRGNVQLVASKKIGIGEDCVLEMPSSAVLLEADPADEFEDPHSVQFGKGTFFAGVVILQSASGINNRSRITIEENATVYGQIYSDNFIEHKGIVYGSMYANKFYRSSRSNTYYNLLSNSETDITKLPQEFLGAAIFEEHLPMDIIKPLY